MLKYQPEVKLLEEINAIRRQNFLVKSIQIEAFNNYLMDLFIQYSTEVIVNNAEGSKCKVISQVDFLKLLSKLPIVIAEIIFRSLDDKKNGYLIYEQFADFQTKLRFGDAKVISEFLFDCFDLDSTKKILIRDIKFILTHISTKYNLKKTGSERILKEEKVILENDISEHINFFFQATDEDEVDFIDFYNKATIGKHDFILFFYNYFYDNISSLSRKLSIYALKTKTTKKNNSSDSLSTKADSSFNIKKPISENKLYNINVKKFLAQVNGKKTQDSNRRSESSGKLTRSIRNDILSRDDLEILDSLRTNRNSSTKTLKLDLEYDNSYVTEQVENRKSIGSFTKLLNSLELTKNSSLNYLRSDSFVLEEYNNNNSLQEDPEKEIKNDIIFEGEIFTISSLTTNEEENTNGSSKIVLSQKYVAILDDILYLYDNFVFYGKFTKAFFLEGCNVRERYPIELNSGTYYPITIYFQNDSQQNFFLKDKSQFHEIVFSIRKSTKFRNFFNYYAMYNEIGKGSFGTVFHCRRVQSNSNYAVKILKKDNIKHDCWKRIKLEIDILKAVDHPNIVKFIDRFENSEYYFIVLEYLKDGCLSDLIKNKKIDLTESMIKKIILPLAQALQYLNKFGVVHRDIKPDNILVEKKDEELKVRLSDFGLAKILSKNETSNECCGSVPFCAPELLKRQNYGVSVDVWSLGMLIFYLLSSSFPFIAYKDKGLLVRSICCDKYSYSNISNRSSNVSNLIRKCLKKDVNKRICIDEVLNHPWFV